MARFGNEGIPCGAACVDDGGVTLEDTVAEVVLAQELPDVLHRVQFGRIGRRMKEADVFWDPQLAACLMPSGSVKEQDGVTAGRHLAADLLEMQVHRFGIGIRQDQSRADIATRTDSAEYVGPLTTLVARRGRAAAALGPNAGQRALLANPGFILPPKFDRFFARMLGDDGFDQIGKVFLCVSCAAGSCRGCRGRTDSRRKPRRRSIAPTLRSAKITLNRALITRARSTRRQRTTPSTARSGPLRTSSATAASCSGLSRGFGPAAMRLQSPAMPSAL